MTFSTKFFSCCCREKCFLIDQVCRKLWSVIDVVGSDQARAHNNHFFFFLRLFLREMLSEGPLEACEPLLLLLLLLLSKEEMVCWNGLRLT